MRLTGNGRSELSSMPLIVLLPAPSAPTSASRTGRIDAPPDLGTAPPVERRVVLFTSAPPPHPARARPAPLPPQRRRARVRRCRTGTGATPLLPAGRRTAPSAARLLGRRLPPPSRFCA